MITISILCVWGINFCQFYLFFQQRNYKKFYLGLINQFFLLAGRIKWIQISFRRFLSKIGHSLWKNETLCFIPSIVQCIVFLAFGINLDLIMLPIPSHRTYTFGLPLRSLSSMSNSPFLNFWNQSWKLLSLKEASPYVSISNRCWSQNVGAGGPHHAPMWKHTQSSAPCWCVPLISIIHWMHNANRKVRKVVCPIEGWAAIFT